MTEYTVRLDERTAQVPAITPQSEIVGQTYTIGYGCVNARTTITVQSKDKSQTGHYYIDFEVRPLTNTKLGKLSISEPYGDQLDVDETEHTFVYDPTAAFPTVLYEAGEPEQRIIYTRKSGNDTEIEVIAQSGESRTYKVHFTTTLPTAANVLTSLTVNGVAQDLTAGDVFNVTLPYGSTDLTVDYNKNYPGQAVFVYNGGVTQPTQIIVCANHPDVADKKYTIIPTLDTLSLEGKLIDLTFNGTTVPNFKPYVYNYVVNVTAQPAKANFAGTAYNGAGVTVSNLDNKNKKVTLTVAGGKTYTVSWFYENDKDPFDFSGTWVSAGTTGSKPSADWVVVADKSAGHTYKIAGYPIPYTTGLEVSQSGENAALLSSIRQAAIRATVPGMMTLGDMSVTLKDGSLVGCNSSSSVTVNATNGAQFRNTPQQLAFEYKPMKGDGISAWSVKVWLSDGSNLSSVAQYSGNYNSSSLQSTAINLNYPSGNVAQINATLNSCGTENIGDDGGLNDNHNSRLLLQNMHLVYNSLVQSATINGKAATVNNTNRTIAITIDNEETRFPELVVTGQVTDQEQVITWGEEKLVGDKMVRAGTLRNYGEDHSYTDYTVTTSRDAVTSTALKSVKFGTKEVTFTDNSYVMPKETPIITWSDINIEATSVHQGVAVEHRTDSVIITVTPEKGETKKYIICFKEQVTSVATISIQTSATLEPAWNTNVNDYSVVVMPTDFSFTKDLFQSVTMDYNADTTRFYVTSSDKSTHNTYTFARATKATSANINSVKFDGENKTLSPTKPTEVDLMPKVVTFARQDATDEVTETIYTDSIIIAVTGSSKTNTYKIVNKNEQDHNAYLAGVLIDGEPYEDFDMEPKAYTIEVDSMVDLQFIPASQTQTLEISVSQGRRTAALRTASGSVEQAPITFTVKVTAKDGTFNTYIYTLEAPKSSDAALKGIVIGNDTINEFYADKLKYTFELPSASPKVNQPEIPAVRYITSDPQATVEVEPAVLGEENTITVKSADGDVTKFYKLTLVAQKSTYADLDGILVDNILVPGFSADRFFYSVQVEPDKFIDTTMVRDGNTVIINVTAEDGIHSQRYFVELYEVEKSNNTTLADLLYADVNTKQMVSVPDFDPMNNVYTIDVPSSVANLPDVTAVPMVTGQTITPRKEGWTVKVKVEAPNKENTNTYTIHFNRPLDNNSDLENIKLDGKDLPGFEPKNYVYLYDLPIGQNIVPKVLAVPATSLQDQKEPRVIIDDVKLRAQIINYAQNGDSSIYTIVFNETYSAADTLLAIRYNNKMIDGFAPKKFDYVQAIPAGQALPDTIECERADDFQDVNVTLTHSDEGVKRYRVEVLAHKGLEGHSNVYTVAFEKELLSIARIDNLKLNGKPLDGFKWNQYEYNVELPAGTTALPTYDIDIVELMELYHETIQCDTLVNKYRFTVTAENGRDFAIYTIYFNVALNKDATLNGIIYGRDNIVPNFFSTIKDYTVELPLGTTNVPQITYIKKYDKQNVDQSYDPDNNWRVFVDVTAEDTTSTFRYTIDFVLAKSSNTELKDIVFADSTVVLNFDPTELDYTIIIPYAEDRDTAHHMFITPIPSENGQIISVDSARYGDLFAVKIYVTAPNGDEGSPYQVVYTYQRNPDASLKALLLNNDAFADFRTDTLEYNIEFPVGTEPSQYYQPEDVKGIANDPLAKVNVKIDQSYTIYITVTAQDTTSTRTYIIHQLTILSDDNYLADLIIDGVSLRGFDPEVLDYTYYVPIGSTAIPLIEAIPRDPLAQEPSIMAKGVDSTTIISCVAQNGKRRVYTILFTNSEINDNDAPKATDVIVKHIFGTNQILVASLRKKVAFGLFDMAGRLVQYVENVEPVDPNNAIMAVDGNVTSGTIITLNPNELYFYTFFEAGEKKVTSGKLIITN